MASAQQLASKQTAGKVSEDVRSLGVRERAGMITESGALSEGGKAALNRADRGQMGETFGRSEMMNDPKVMSKAMADGISRGQNLEEKKAIASDMVKAGALEKMPSFDEDGKVVPSSVKASTGETMATTLGTAEGQRLTDKMGGAMFGGYEFKLGKDNVSASHNESSSNDTSASSKEGDFHNIDPAMTAAMALTGNDREKAKASIMTGALADNATSMKGITTMITSIGQKGTAEALGGMQEKGIISDEQYEGAQEFMGYAVPAAAGVAGLEYAGGRKKIKLTPKQLENTTPRRGGFVNASGERVADTNGNVLGEDGKPNGTVLSEEEKSSLVEQKEGHYDSDGKMVADAEKYQVNKKGNRVKDGRLSRLYKGTRDLASGQNTSSNEQPMHQADSHDSSQENKHPSTRANDEIKHNNPLNNSDTSSIASPEDIVKGQEATVRNELSKNIDSKLSALKTSDPDYKSKRATLLSAKNAVDSGAPLSEYQLTGNKSNMGRGTSLVFQEMTNRQLIMVTCLFYALNKKSPKTLYRVSGFT